MRTVRSIGLLMMWGTACVGCAITLEDGAVTQEVVADASVGDGGAPAEASTAWIDREALRSLGVEALVPLDPRWTALQSSLTPPGRVTACRSASDWNLDGRVDRSDLVLLLHLPVPSRGEALGRPLVAVGDADECVPGAVAASRREVRPGWTVPIVLRDLPDDGVHLSAFAADGAEIAVAETALRALDRSGYVGRAFAVDIPTDDPPSVVYATWRVAGVWMSHGMIVDEHAPDWIADAELDTPPPSASPAAGAPDAGAPDAGAPPTRADAGVPPDAGPDGGPDAAIDAGADARITESEECPQRGDGCAFLWIDYFTPSELEVPRGERAWTDPARAFTDMRCDVYQWHARDHGVFEKPDPPPDPVIIEDRRGRVIYSSLTSQSPQARRWRDDFAAARARLADWMRRVPGAIAARDRAIASYRDRLRAGAESAYELVTAHGSNWAHKLDRSGSACGYWGTRRAWGDYAATPPLVDTLNRADFVQGNYDAALEHVCSRFMMDLSCSSGFSVIANAYANNTGTASCTSRDAPTDTHPRHAGYRSDAAYSAGGLVPCTFENVRDALRALDGAASSGEFGLTPIASVYTDGGNAHPGGSYLCRGIAYSIAAPR
ncbi:MAG: hypothetical protein AB7S26_26520 [Sandaracinaceae bacterium]